jgi:hypothetical protein
MENTEEMCRKFNGNPINQLLGFSSAMVICVGVAVLGYWSVAATMGW